MKTVKPSLCDRGRTIFLAMPEMYNRLAKRCFLDICHVSLTCAQTCFQVLTPATAGWQALSEMAHESSHHGGGLITQAFEAASTRQSGLHEQQPECS